MIIKELYENQYKTKNHFSFGNNWKIFLENINKTLKTNIKCPPHHIHLLMGIFFYFTSVYISQRDSKEFKTLMSRMGI